MKVLLINNFHYRKGGSEAVYFGTADILKKAGYEVVFFSTKDDEHNISCKQEHFFIKRNEEKSLLKGAISYIYNNEAARKLEELIITEQPDIAHVHLFWGCFSPSIFKVLKKYNIPLIHTAHDYRMVCPAYTFNCNGSVCEACKGKHFYKCALKKCSKGNLVQSSLMAVEMYIRQRFFNPVKHVSGFIFVSEFARQKHIQYNKKFEDANSIVLYNYTEDYKQVYPKQHDDYILFFGRLSYEKGIKTLIESAVAIRCIKVKIVGTGPLEDELKSVVARTYNVDIEFLGYKTGNELKNVVKNAKFVVVPSECYENNPMTIIESYSMGTPVIGARIGGIPEIVEEGKTGFTFTPGCKDELADIIRRAAKLEEDEYQQLCKGAYDFYQRNFSEHNYLDKLVSFYNVLKK